MIYVLAENYRHFVHWCNISGLNPNGNDARYVSEPHKLWGVNADNNTFIYYETWRNHPNATELNSQIVRIQAISKLIKSDVQPLPVVRRKNFMFTWEFWKQALERLIRAFATSLLTLTGADAFNVVSTNWGDKLP